MPNLTTHAPISACSFAKINVGLKIGPVRADGFHELRTIYQTIALHDLITVEVQEGSGIEIRCADPRVPRDESNTCYKIAERVLAAMPQGLKPESERDLDGTAEAVSFQNQMGEVARAVPVQGGSDSGTPEKQIPRELKSPRDDKQLASGPAAETGGKIVITIDKRLPVQGGMGAASSNGVATMLALEHALGRVLPPAEKLRIAAEVGSDLPLFLIGGTVLGAGRGEDVYPLADLLPMHLVVVAPALGVSTVRAFAQWDEYVAREGSGQSDVSGSAESAAGAIAGLRFAKRSNSVAVAAPGPTGSTAALTGSDAAGTMSEFGKEMLSSLKKDLYPQVLPASGVPAKGGDRAETLLLDLVRTGIENDFERVVFLEYPELREVKSVLEREGARYASLSGSGSTVYGIFGSAEEARTAAAQIRAAGHAAVATQSLTREKYWREMFVAE